MLCICVFHTPGHLHNCLTLADGNKDQEKKGRKKKPKKLQM